MYALTSQNLTDVKFRGTIFNFYFLNKSAIARRDIIKEKNNNFLDLQKQNNKTI
jgi:hypothetical protein